MTISLSQQVNIDANAIIINQYGIYNTTHINQAANSSNLASITQFGESNSVDILQLGIGNSVVLVQSGNESTAEVFQHGDNNVATINQSNGQHFAVQQIGNEMVVNITQYRK
ncbi:hypothetical protein OE749_10150 [Aestuariibacter sp. AA17]|uniref:Curlin minor subunit CsgB n=1 Tax=Fluctibacter corallii TaxID=2984329 RepID=A0ABT3A8R3_9ALTE|nr:hypothetical protein [Aestuariibacter sp. AA17]MCV2885051.1 hypothetical protein [Aestuariibacter sp. AA17]